MKKLTRKKQGRVIAGVSGGIGEYIGLDPVIVRLVLIFLFIVTGLVPIVILYLAAIFLVPEEADPTIRDI